MKFPESCKIIAMENVQSGISYNNGDALCEIALGDKWLVSPKDELLQKLKNKVGNDMVHLRF